MSNLLAQLGAHTACFAKGSTILLQGERADSIGVILQGNAKAVKTQYNGTHLLVALLQQGSVFGDVLAGGKGRKSPIRVEACSHVTALFLPGKSLTSPGRVLHEGQSQLLSNYIGELSEKYFSMFDRIDCILQPSIREKVLSYLERFGGPGMVVIPLNRSEMAAYLNVERSALSRELSKMKKDGLIDFHKNTFQLMRGGA